MSRSDPPENWHDKIADYVLGNLAPEDVAALQAELARNPDLAQELAELQATWSALPYALPNPQPKADLKAATLAKLQQPPETVQQHVQQHVPQHIQQHLQPQPESDIGTALPQIQRSRPGWRPNVLWSVTSAIAAGLILVLGFDNYRLRQQATDTVQLQQTLLETQADLDRLQQQLRDMETVVASLQVPEAMIHTLVGTGSAAGAQGRIVVTPGESEIVLVSENLPVLSDDQIYRLWAIADATEPPLYCGQFRPNQSGTVHWQAPSLGCSDNPSQLLITQDRPDDSIESAGPLIMRSQA